MCTYTPYIHIDTSKHDSEMAPIINGGLVIKHNANQRYATNALSATLFREFAKLEGLPMQEFSVRADMGCGRYAIVCICYCVSVSGDYIV